MGLIHVVINTVKISKKCAKELFDIQKRECWTWESLEDVTDDGLLDFNPDHEEHMDFLGSDKKIVKILLKHKVKGDITFADLEKPNAGLFWGYRFDGKGGMKELKGELIFKEKD